jgi:hypothetical protein
MLERDSLIVRVAVLVVLSGAACGAEDVPDAAGRDGGSPSRDAGERADTGVPPLDSGGPLGRAPVPLDWDDPVFADVTESGFLRLDDCETRSDLSIEEDGPAASVHGGCFTLNRTRIRSREAIRVANGNVELNWVWVEANALAYEGDHADGLQTYNPGQHGDITVRNSTFRAYNENATAGYFASDDWHGIHRFENVLFWGGPFGLRLHEDGGEGVYMNNVFFVRDSFREAPLRINMPILEWNNVRWVTIEDGELVMGDPISQP